MNQLRIAGCTAGAFDKAAEQIIDRSLLWERDGQNLWIKDLNDIIGIGGNIKQNKLIAGDNIEIIEDDEIYEGVSWLHPMIRVADDIKVHSCTLSPGTEEDPIPDWKGTIFLGEIKDGNLVYLITKATQVKDEDQALFGGQILVKMTTKDGRDVYAQYAVTITSTGSWSLWGGNNASSNVRVCKAKYKGEWYYGLKIPSGDFINIKTIDEPTYSDTKTKGANNRLYFQVGSGPGEYYVGWAGKGTGGTKLQFEEDLGTLTGYPDVTIKKYSLAIKDLVDNEFLEEENKEEWLKVISNDEIKENQWARWYTDEEKIYFEIASKPNYAGKWKTLETSSKIKLNWKGKPNGTYEICNFSLSTQGREEGFTECGEAVPDANDPQELGLSRYNHWYSMSMVAFQRLLGFTFEGEWAKFVTNHHILCFRIYYKFATGSQWGQQSTRVTRIQIRDTAGTNTAATLGGTAGEVVYDFKTSAEDMPFKWDNTDLMNLTRDPTDVYYLHTSDNISETIGEFKDRLWVNEGDPLSEVIAIQGITYPSDLEDEILSAKYDIPYYRANTNQCKSWIYSSPIPLFMDWSEANSTTLIYNKGNNSWCFMMDVVPTWVEIVGHHYKDVYFTDNLEIEKTEIWYNGWYDLPEPLIPPQPPTSELEFQVLARESQDEDSFSEVFFSSEPIPTIVRRINELQDLGEDAPPYKWVITNRVLTLADLQLLAENIRNADKQLWIDLSGCSVAEDAQTWTTQLFSGCASLRGFVIPTGVKSMVCAPFIWCTYMRYLDLTPSLSTLTTLGGATGWSLAIGLLTSTRVRDLLLPRNFAHFQEFFVYSSNVQNLIMLHRATDAMVDASLRAFYGEVKENEKAYKDYRLPDGFHWFMSEEYKNALETYYWTDGGSRTNRNANGSLNLRYQWGGFKSVGGSQGENWFTEQVCEKIVTFKPDGDQAWWQNFNNEHHWGEELINRVRREFNPSCSDFEIIDYTFMQ